MFSDIQLDTLFLHRGPISFHFSVSECVRFPFNLIFAPLVMVEIPVRSVDRRP